MEGQRRLPRSIDAAAGKLLASVAQTRADALHQREAAAVQTGQIALVCGAVQTLIADLDALCGQAAELAEAALHAAALAARGIQTVRKALAGMTADGGPAGSEQVARCGESVHRLGALLERLTDSVHEINVLALNAVIQAARMGASAPDDFAVFAAEVLSVAGESGGSTGQCQALVCSLQSDLQAALRSLQTGGAAAVPGADLMPQAEEALRQIETAGGAGANLVRGLADALQHQSRQAAALTETVQALRAITAESAQGGRGLAQSQEDLVTFAAELQRLAAQLRSHDERRAYRWSARHPRA